MTHLRWRRPAAPAGREVVRMGARLAWVEVHACVEKGECSCIYSTWLPRRWRRPAARAGRDDVRSYVCVGGWGVHCCNPSLQLQSFAGNRTYPVTQASLARPLSPTGQRQAQSSTEQHWDTPAQ